jgi:opacity protein-like surface antigen
MKKIILAATAIFTMMSSQAQISTSVGIEAGVTGTNIRSINFDGTEKSEYPMGGGFYVGGILHLNKEKPVSIQTGLIYSSNKAKESTQILSVPGLSTRGEVDMSYIEVPINIVFRSEKCLKNWSAYLGPQFRYAVSGHRHYKFYGASVAPIDSDIEFGKASTEFKALQTAFAVGLSRKIAKAVTLNATYQFGVNDIDNVSNYDTKFNSLKLGIRYMFK